MNIPPLLLLAAAFVFVPLAAQTANLPRLKVSPDGRFFVQEDGKPFFYLGDTAWGLFAHATREDIDHYLDDRVKKQFTVIQAVTVLWDGTRRRNPYGHLPLEGADPTKPNEAYFQHVDYAIDQAAARGLYIAVLPFWVKGFIRETNSQLLDAAKMRTFCEFLGKRYLDKPIIWVLGGDWPGKDTEELSDAMAAGLRAGDGGRNLVTYHPTGRQSSSFWFHDRPWLDFNFIQSGHFIHNNNYELVADDYAKSPAKPTMDSEPGYENITDRLIRDNTNAVRIGAWDVRRYGYLGVFAGAAGHAYGCGEVYEFWEPGRGRLPGWAAHLPWRESLNLPGAGQMKHLRALIESRPMLARIPDQSFLVGETFRTTERIQATRAQDGSYAFVYTASGKPIVADLNKLSGKTLRAHWYDPRTGVGTLIGELPRAGQREFVPPSGGDGNDWVLVLDDAAKAYPLPRRGLL